MPHDALGTKVEVGDIIKVAFRVTAIQPGDEYCNVSAESLVPMFPSDSPTSCTFNAKQVVVIGHFNEQT